MRVCTQRSLHVWICICICVVCVCVRACFVPIHFFAHCRLASSASARCRSQLRLILQNLCVRAFFHSQSVKRNISWRPHLLQSADPNFDTLCRPSQDLKEKTCSSQAADSSLGAHSEVRVLLYVTSDKDMRPLPANWQTPVELHTQSFGSSGARRLCVSAWHSSTPSAVYAEHVLGLDVRLASARVTPGEVTCTCWRGSVNPRSCV